MKVLDLNANTFKRKSPGLPSETTFESKSFCFWKKKRRCSKWSCRLLLGFVQEWMDIVCNWQTRKARNCRIHWLDQQNFYLRVAGTWSSCPSKTEHHAENLVYCKSGRLGGCRKSAVSSEKVKDNSRHGLVQYYQHNKWRRAFGHC